jgi:hypothetical protein
MTTFIELVILPAVLPWLIVMTTGWIETRLDEDAQGQRDLTGAIANGNSI